MSNTPVFYIDANSVNYLEISHNQSSQFTRPMHTLLFY